MKRYTVLALAMVLGCTLFTGCRRGNGDMMTVPPTTQAATEHYTMPATQPATQPTRPVATEPATQDAAGASTPDSTADATENATGESRSRGMAPGSR